MADGLARPRELGQAPENMEVADTRTLYWPPTQDHRQMWVIRYQHRADGELRESYGLVGAPGGATLPPECAVDLPIREPFDVYALHLCFELQLNADPRAPLQFSFAAGHRLLAAHNPKIRMRLL